MKINVGDMLVLRSKKTNKIEWICIVIKSQNHEDTTVKSFNTYFGPEQTMIEVGIFRTEFFDEDYPDYQWSIQRFLYEN